MVHAAVEANTVTPAMAGDGERADAPADRSDLNDHEHDASPSFEAELQDDRAVVLRTA